MVDGKEYIVYGISPLQMKPRRGTEPHKLLGGCLAQYIGITYPDWGVNPEAL